MNEAFLIYPQDQLPPQWYYQIISFLRIVWPDGFQGENQGRIEISNLEAEPISIMLTIGDILIAHAQIVSKWIQHKSESYKLYGLTAVFVYPAFRKKGYGRRIVELGLQHLLQQSDVDLAMITCEPHNRQFYEKLGWQFDSPGVLVGDKANSRFSDEFVAFRYVSDKAKSHENDFKMTPFYFGRDLW